jgi:chromosome partitioning protein
VRSIALANQKGGVGKTTTAIHLAHGLAILGKRVVLVDLDPQGNAGVALQRMGTDVAEGTTSGGVRRLCETLWIATARSAAGEPDAGFVQDLRSDVSRLEPEWLIADCPPRMDAWGQVGLQLCRQVIVPVQAEFLAMHGLSQIMSTIQATRGECQLAGVLATMVDNSEQISREVVANLRAHLGDLVFDSVILRDSCLVESASHGKSVFEYAPASKAALCYGEFLREVCGG